MSSSDLCGQQANMWYTCIQAGKNTYIKQNLISPAPCRIVTLWMGPIFNQTVSMQHITVLRGMKWVLASFFVCICGMCVFYSPSWRIKVMIWVYSQNSCKGGKRQLRCPLTSIPQTYGPCMCHTHTPTHNLQASKHLSLWWEKIYNNEIRGDICQNTLK